MKIIFIILLVILLSLYFVGSATTITDLGITTPFVNTTNNSWIETLNIMGYNTGDILSDEIDLYIGDDFGAIEIGNVQLFQGDLVFGSLDLNGTFMIRHTGGNSNIRFAWAGADNLIRLAIPREGSDFALYNPRSEMIGGDLGQAFNNGMVNCTQQGYDKIDCATNLTGSDLGVQDDVQIRGTLFVDEEIIIENMEGNYSNGEAFLCVYDNGSLFSKDSACS